jgi:TusE/DsrC/DsvC family sulfur relay protein
LTCPPIVGDTDEAESEEVEGVSTLTHTGVTIEVNKDGFLRRPEQWTEEVARWIAAENGIEPLTDCHWQVIRFMRNEFLETGFVPRSLHQIERHLQMPCRNLVELFAGHDPPLIAAKIAGVPKGRATDHC